jgi:hypothetical protein
MPWIFLNSTKQFAQMVADYTVASVRREFRQMGGHIVGTIEELEAAVNSQWETLAPAVANIQERVRALQEAINSGATSQQLSDLVAEVNDNTTRVAQGLADAMQDPTTPDPTVPLPTPENPLPAPPDGSAETGTESQ